MQFTYDLPHSRLSCGMVSTTLGARAEEDSASTPALPMPVPLPYCRLRRETDPLQSTWPSQCLCHEARRVSSTFFKSAGMKSVRPGAVATIQYGAELARRQCNCVLHPNLPAVSCGSWRTGAMQRLRHGTTVPNEQCASHLRRNPSSGDTRVSRPRREQGMRRHASPGSTRNGDRVPTSSESYSPHATSRGVGVFHFSVPRTTARALTGSGLGVRL